jgi:hypothetical protein
MTKLRTLGFAAGVMALITAGSATADVNFSDDFSYADGALDTSVAPYDSPFGDFHVINGGISDNPDSSTTPSGGSLSLFYNGWTHTNETYIKTSIDVTLPTEEGLTGRANWWGHTGLSLHGSAAQAAGNVAQGGITKTNTVSIRGHNDFNLRKTGALDGCCVPQLIDLDSVAPTSAGDGANQNFGEPFATGPGGAPDLFGELDLDDTYRIVLEEFRAGPRAGEIHTTVTKVSDGAIFADTSIMDNDLYSGGQAGVYLQFLGQPVDTFTLDNFSVVADMSAVPLPAALPAGLALIALVGGTGVIRRMRRH